MKIMCAQTLLDKIIKADAADWTYPSPARAIEIARLEREYEALTGKPCPAWPARGRW
jgi:putative NADH-flavin reductase